MLTDLAQGGDVAAVAAAVDEQCPNAGRPRPRDILLGRVADVEGLIRADSGELQRLLEDRGIGLAGPGPCRAHDAIEQPAEAAALQHGGERAASVPDGDQAL